MQTAEIKSAKQVLRSATVRDFSGGWNILDNDLNLDSRYSTKLYNCAVLSDGTVTVRYGTKLFANLQPYLTSSARVVNIEYYADAIIAVCSNGNILRVFGDGSVARIWDNTIASALPGNPAGWSDTDFASFAQFNGELIICNGVDKPLIVNADLEVEYLADLGTGSNLNTPICKFVTVCDRYLVMAGDPEFPNRIHISSKDTSGTFYGDPDPNDATFVDVGSILRNSTYIRGISSFRGKLIIGYNEGTIVYVLGEYNDTGDHIPRTEDPVEQYGASAHRAMISYGDDMLMTDLVGIPSLKRTVFTGTLRPERISDLIDPEITRRMAELSLTSVEDRVFAVYNQRDGQFMFFIPNSDSIGSTTETTAYVFSYRHNLNLSAWARYDGWNFTCACTTSQGLVVFGDKNGKLWYYGYSEDQFFKDYLNDPDINSGLGTSIIWNWELPWIDLKQRLRSKTTRYIGFDTVGTDSFTVDVFLDRFVNNSSGAQQPHLSATFVGGDAGGFGIGAEGAYGGGSTADERLISWPSKFQIAKFSLRGEAESALKFVSMSLYYQMGGFKR